MSKGRPKPTILATHRDKKYYDTDICSADCLFVVLYKDTPFNVRRRNALLNHADKQNKVHYRTGVFVSLGNAMRMAADLNTQFQCSDFAVKKIDPTKGEPLV